MSNLSLYVTTECEPPGEVCEAAPSVARLREVVVREHAFVWRSLRRLGVAELDVDDGVQKVFLVASRRLGAIPPSRERAFLFGTAMRVASNERRGETRRRSNGPDELETLRSDERSPETIAHHRALLDRLLEPLSLELRSAIVLFELEGLTVDEIAEIVGIPAGTAASRIRRAREQIHETKRLLEGWRAQVVRGAP